MYSADRSRILALARAGSPVRAWETFDALGLAKAPGDARVLTLKGRLLKDLGKRARADERLDFYRAASQAYLEAFDVRPDSYPLINAATLALLSGDEAKARELAQCVLDLIEADPDEGETAYWREATKAEALLLLGERDKADEALRTGIARLPRAWEDHAATIGQFERIIAEQHGDPAWLDTYRPAPCVHFSGMIGLDPEEPGLEDRIAAKVAELGPGFAYGALAAGADILLAEALVEAGAQLHVVLPFSPERFRETSVAPYGANWEARFDRLLDAADTVEDLGLGGDEPDLPLEPAFSASTLAAMGTCLRHADALRTRAHALTIKDPDEQQRSDLDVWEGSGLDLHTIETKRVATGSASRSEDNGPRSPTLTAAIIGARGAQLSDRPELAIAFDTQLMQITGPLKAVFAAVEHIQASHRNAAIGMAIESGDYRQSGAGLASRMAQSANAGQVYADRGVAMIAKVLDPARRVEEMGEVSTLSGPLGVFSISA